MITAISRNVSNLSEFDFLRAKMETPGDGVFRRLCEHLFRSSIVRGNAASHPIVPEQHIMEGERYPKSCESENDEG